MPKQFVRIAGKTVLEHTLEVFEDTAAIDQTVVVTNPEYRELVEEILLRRNFSKIGRVLNGGTSRRQSSRIGIESVDEDDAFVLVHDAVRPFVARQTIDQCVDALKCRKAVDVAIPVADTIVQATDDGLIESIPERSRMRRGQTPQGFHSDILKEAHRRASQEDIDSATDDCTLVLRYDLAPVELVEGRRENIKITYSSDIFLAERLYQIRRRERIDAGGLERLKDKILVVFGGTQGIGQAVCAEAKKAGARPIPLSRRTGVDIRDEAQVREALDSVQQAAGRIDYVVNSAAILHHGRLETQAGAEVAAEIDTNYLGVVNVVRAAAPYLRRNKGSLALFTSSSYTRGRRLYSVYSSTKAAVVNLVQAVADEWAADDIKINAICPQRTSTPMRWKAFGEEPEDTLLSPSTVANATLKTLVSELTGQVVDVRKDRDVD